MENNEVMMDEVMMDEVMPEVDEESTEVEVEGGCGGLTFLLVGAGIAALVALLVSCRKKLAELIKSRDTSSRKERKIKKLNAMIDKLNAEIEKLQKAEEVPENDIPDESDVDDKEED